MERYDYKKNIDKNGCIIPPKDFSPFVINEIITVNKNMRYIIDLCKRVAVSKASILITGESGVGKEMIAELIHKNSKRANSPFVKLNCAAIPENLIESEFFGYEAGAFTGALKSGKKGIIELADTGTLFLDEVGEMPLNLQSKLLRVLQNGKFIKVGGDKELNSNVRIISATNKDLEMLIHEGLFREDLYFRLNVIPIRIPPLRERKDDIPIISLYFLDYYNKFYNINKKISEGVMNLLVDIDWTGNIRELKNTIERLVLISLDDVITENDFVYSSFASKRYSTVEKKNYENLEEYDEDLSLKELVTNYEIKIILKTVKKYGSLRKASHVLKVSPSTLSRKITAYYEGQSKN